MQSRVSAASNLFDYFNEKVEHSRATRRVRISDDTSLYLTTLLADRARSDRPEAPENTLAELHARAAASAPAEQAKAYRELGDRALYLVGYFAESLSRRVVGPAYYSDMGAAAYHRVDILFRAIFADAFGPVFRELAQRFDDCVTIVGDVKDAHRRSQADTDTLMHLYESWIATGDDRLREQLLAAGVLVPPTLGDST